MLKIDNFEVLGWEHAIRGMRNPMNSWEKSDSDFCTGDKCFYTDECWNQSFKGNEEGCPLRAYDADGNSKIMKIEGGFNAYIIGPNDHDLMMRLRKAGTDHRKFMRMITVYLDIAAPLYWWKEMDTYQVGVVKNSCSTMHKIAAKEFTLEDFSCEHLLTFDEVYRTDDKISYCEDCGTYSSPLGILEDTIRALNFYRRKYLETKSKPMKDEKARQALMKKYWWQMIQLLPSSYNQKRTVMLNYEVLANIYKSRKDHKLDEWHTFCHWIEELPYSEIILGKYSDEEE